MLTIYVSPRNIQITTVDGSEMSVRGTFVRGESGSVSLQDWEPQPKLEGVEIVLIKRFFNKKLRLPQDLLQAMVVFLQSYHAQQDISIDCYAFANLVKGVEPHKVHFMLKYWETKPLPWRVPVGSVVFLQSGENRFHHAAIYIGSGLYISVWGAGGDLEIATLKSMKKDFAAERAVLAQPQETAN